ncbi:MAG: hypothetical protein L3K06_02010 [Thermoplasmata archaeon]|nr:hypothetical protein [Thermoplasmata archaeon]MCI4354123.1 hypothetical protein [Thermoplasmata archaeon]
MEYVVVRALHPTYLSVQLPVEVAELIQFRPDDVRELRSPSRGISFLARGPGIVRVVASFAAGEMLGLETIRNRYVAPARVSAKFLFSLPAPVIEHLGLQTRVRGPSGVKATDDGILWFVPAPEYYEFRARERTPKGWTGPSTGGFAHVYLARSVLPMGPSFENLALLEDRIEAEEWRPRNEALQHVGRRSR